MAGGVAFIVMGIALLGLRPARSGASLFGAYAIVSGGQQIFANVGAVGPAAFSLASYPFLAATPPLLVGAAAAYAHRDPRVWALPFASVAVGGTFVLLLEPRWMLANDAFLAAAGHYLWSMPPFLAMGVASLLVASAAREAPGPELRIEAVVLFAAIAPFAAYVTMVSTGSLLRNPSTFVLAQAGYIATFVFAAAFVAMGCVVLLRAGAPGGKRVVAIVIVVAVAAFAHAYFILGWTYFGGLIRIATAALLAYGLLKYGIFDVDLKLKASIDRGAILAAFGVVYFAVEQAVEYYASSTFGTIAGVTAALLLLLAFKPLRRWSQGLADRAFPRVGTSPDYEEDRRFAVYRSAAQAAARDGRTTPRERAMLDALIQELGLAKDKAAAIDREVQVVT